MSLNRTVTVSFDVPFRQVELPRPPTWSDFLEVFNRVHHIDLKQYDLTDSDTRTKIDHVTYDRSIALQVFVKAELRVQTVYHCLECIMDFREKATFREHFPRGCPRIEKRREEQKIDPQLPTLFLQDGLSAVNSVFTALTALPVTMQQLKQLDLRKSDVLSALARDLNGGYFGPDRELVQAMKRKLGDPFALPLDVLNAITGDLMEFTDFMKKDNATLVVDYSDRKQLVADLKVSDLLKDSALAETLQRYDIQLVAEEFIMSLIWDKSPDFLTTFQVFSKLLGEMTALTSNRRAGVLSLVLSKSTLSVAVIPTMNETLLTVVSNGASMKMSPEDLLRTAVMWGLKPDLVFLASRSATSLPRMSSDKGKKLEALATAMTNIQVRIDLPFIDANKPKEVVKAPEDSKTSKWQKDEDLDTEEELYGATNSPETKKEQRYSPPKFTVDDLVDSPPKNGTRPPLTWKCANCRREVPGALSVCPHCKPLSEKPESQFTLGRKLVDLEDDLLAASPQKDTRWKCSCGVSNNPVLDRCISCRKAKKAEVTPEKKWKCQQCKKDNEESSARCVFCRSLRREATEKVASDWTCKRCFATNAETRLFCSECREMKPAVTVKETLKPDPPKAAQSPTKGAQSPTKTIQGRMDLKTVESKQGPTRLVEWRCPCSKANSAARQSCLWCGLQKPSTDNKLDRQGSSPTVCRVCRNSTSLNGVLCEVCRLGQSPSESGVWTCKKCITVNTNSSAQCKQCRKKREADETGRTETMWKCVCGNSDNFEDDEKCYACQRPRSAVATGWTCEGCRETNSDKSTTCSSCRRPRTSDCPPWTCVKCQTKNRTSTCSLCSKEQGSTVQQRLKFCECGNKITGDAKRCIACETKQDSWKCKICQSTNRTVADKCTNCQVKRPKSKRCTECSNTIYGDEVMCPTCKNKAEGTRTWKCPHCRASVAAPGRCRQCAVRS